MPATDVYWRNLKKMHVWFAVSSLGLLATTVWMLADDHNREYFDYQRTYYRLEALRAQAKVEAIETPEFLKELAALEAERDEAKAQLDARADEIESLRQALDEAELKFSLAEDELKRMRSERDVARANRDLAVRDEKPQPVISALQTAFEEEQRKVEAQELVVEDLKGKRDAAKQKLAEATARLDDAEAKLRAKRQQIDQLNKQRLKVQPETWGKRWKRHIMEWPIIQGFNSHLKIHQDWLPDLHIKLGMASSARFDRCRTCHLGIDQVEAGNVPSYPFGKPSDGNLKTWVEENKYPQPYATHPRPELYMTASSPHPVATFGCTICHDGNGSGTSFQNAEHRPDNPYEAEHWAEQYHYHANHFWEYPMQTRRLLESTCLKCHHHVEELGVNPRFGASAPKVYAGYRTIQQFGCFGCHEIHGYEGDKSIGPDLRLEPNYTEAALQFRWLLRQRKTATAGGISPAKVDEYLDQIIDHPEESSDARGKLTELIAKDKQQKSDALKELALNRKLSTEQRRQKREQIESAHLSADAAGLADQLKDQGHPGKYRKVGPSLRYVKAKLPEAFIPYWVEEPKRFRPTTRMPQFFKLTNLQDAHGRRLSAAELIAIGEYLYDNSQTFEPLPLRKGAEPPDADRGERFFKQKGCLACHSRSGIVGATADFGPDLTLIAAKVKRDADNPNFSSWLYTWVRDPQRYHKRSRMPHLFLDLETETTVGPDGKSKSVTYDTAADIVAYLLRESEQTKAKRAEFQQRAKQIAEVALTVNPETKQSPLDELVRHYLRKTLTTKQVDGFFETLKYPVQDLSQIKGDEIELAEGTLGRDLDPNKDAEEWRRVKLRYLGRKTISRYGCFGCHDVPGFERGRPIGTTLQDWGRKDRTKLAFEHITEYLHHHGEADGSSTLKRAESAVKRVAEGSFTSEREKDRELAVAFFYERIQHHDRPGFIWQKLRQPRSYDYEKTETKAYDERLRMPKFPLREEQVEQVATFVLGLVAEPPPEKYQYRPAGAAYDRVEGERLLKKYNCVGCHMLRLPKITYWTNLNVAPFNRKPQGEPPLGHDLLMTMMPPRRVDTSLTRPDPAGGDATQTRISFHGLPVFEPDEDPLEENQRYFQNWEHLDVNGTEIAPGPGLFVVGKQNLPEITSGRGGHFAEWLFRYLKQQERRLDLKAANIARHKIPPVLYREGYKVQTAWLYRFLREPHRIRQLTVLRMPRFSLSSHDAQTLANYFAAVEGVPYPYQQVPQRSPEYLSRQDRKYRPLYAKAAHPEYLAQAWKLLLNRELCRKCHSVGGFPAQQASGPDAIRAPNLEYAPDRLRPDWTLLWISDPRWTTPYTQMPVNFTKDKRQFPESFDGRGEIQVRAVRDALMNYHALMEQYKQTVFQYPAVKQPAAGAAPGNGAPANPQKKPPAEKAAPGKKPGT